MGPVLVEAFRYHRWASLHLLDVCAKLSDEQLQLSSPGTMGTIAATLTHLVAAEQRYLWRFDAEEPRLREKDGFPGIGVLREHAARSGDQLIEKVARLQDGIAGMAKLREGEREAPLAMILVQALHHGNDHRTHVCTILGQHDISYGDMDVWAYGEAIGAYQAPPEA
ncbi:MAG TPA: DinB family protein [Candidatus Dormibacteraeota bacterium]|nr:DinB family protein [Candidatus Dormibacteraeota bacterium]